jgi:hypothetical protein
VYALIICNIIKESTVEHQVKALNNMMSYITNTFEMQILFIELKEYENVFLIESINRLSLHEEHDHAIEITAESSYDLLYNLLNMKLATLRQYLNDVLTKE